MLTESKVAGVDEAALTAIDDDADVVIRLENVSVEYHAPRERITSFKEYAIRLLQRRVQHDEFKALRNVSLEIKRGEVFGVIGHNGAGKSTLLKTVSRVMKPTRGRVWVKGRIAPLLELGAGFHSELSGRENIFLNGTLLGYTHAQIKTLFDGIVDFAELREFIDAPLRTYSTGMAVRLGFAVATATRPDILIVDEVLSVGDEQFQEKCTARMNEFRSGGTTILLVTHASKLIAEICDRAVWIDHGEVRVLGEPRKVIDLYQETYHPRQPAQSEASAARVHVAKRLTNDAANPLTPLEKQVLEKEWFYRFDLPSGNQTPCYLPPQIATYHDDRLAMMFGVLQPRFGRKWAETSCLDIGCNQGYFSLKLAEQGSQKVLGVDARRENIADAELIRQVYDLPNLNFRVADLMQIDPDEFEKFDVVLMFSMVFSLENPIGAIRTARALTKEVLLIETLAAPEISGQIDWGSHQWQKQLQGSFALLDQREEINNPLCSLTGISLCPGRETLIWLLKRLNFSRVEIIPPPSGAYEQLASGKRVMIAAYVL